SPMVGDDWGDLYDLMEQFLAMMEGIESQWSTLMDDTVDQIGTTLMDDTVDQIGMYICI
ncbi:hypothetical protein KIPB_014383, partial [Kipferlia bialata]